MHEQGAGLINLENSRKILETYRPRASLIPADVDLTAAACPYAWPHCAQPLYHGAMPFMFNATVANGMGVVGWLEAAPEWIPDDAAEEGTTRSSSSGDASRSKIGGAHLDVRFAHSEVLWPWSGYLALYVRVRESAKALQGVASGTVRFAVCSPARARRRFGDRSSRLGSPFPNRADAAEVAASAVVSVPLGSVPAGVRAAG